MPWTKEDADLVRLSVGQKFKQWQDEVFHGLGRKSGKTTAARNFMEQSEYAQRLTDRMLRDLFPPSEFLVSGPERKVTMSRLTPVGLNGTVATKNGLVVTVNQLLGMQENQRAELVKMNKTIVDLRSRIVNRDKTNTTISDLEDRNNKLRRRNDRLLEQADVRIGDMKALHRRNEQLTACVQAAMDRTSKISETLTEHIGDNPDHAGCADTIELLRVDNAALRNQIKVMGDVSATQQELIVHPEHINTADVEIQLRGQAILKLCHRAHDRKQTIYGLRQAVSGYRKKLKELHLG